jgi:hypothetical protein
MPADEHRLLLSAITDPTPNKGLASSSVIRSRFDAKDNLPWTSSASQVMSIEGCWSRASMSSGARPHRLEVVDRPLPHRLENPMATPASYVAGLADHVAV